MKVLEVKKNRAYTLGIPDGNQLETKCIHDVSNSETQDRLGKDRIGKVSLGKERIDYDGIKDAYNTTCPSLPAIKSLSDARKKAIKARMNQYSVEEICEAFEKAEASDFLKGKNDRNWTANFDWIMKDANLAKILDGNYDNRAGAKSTAPQQAGRLDWIDDI